MIATLRTLLSNPSTHNWNAICALMDDASKLSVLEEVLLPYALEHLEAWPVGLCLAPEYWVKEIFDEQFSPKFQIIRRLHFPGRTLTSERLKKVCEQDIWNGLRSLECWETPKLFCMEDWDYFTSSPLFAQIEDLEMNDFSAPAKFWDMFFISPFFRQLRTLNLRHLRLTDEYIAILIETLQEGCIESLGLEANRLTYEGIRTITEASLPHLRHLLLGNEGVRHDTAVFNKIGVEGVEAIASSELGEQLESLDIGYNQLDDDAMKKLCEGSFHSLSTLRLQSNHFTGDGIASLAKVPWLGQLKELNVRSHGIGARRTKAWFAKVELESLRKLSFSHMSMGLLGAKGMVSNESMKELRELDLRHNKLKVNGVKALFSTSNFGMLESLDLSNNAIGDDGLAVLADSPQLQHLHTLILNENEIGDEGVKALARSPYIQKLKILSLRGNKVSNSGLAALADSDLLLYAEKLNLYDNYRLTLGGFVSFFQSSGIPCLAHFLSCKGNAEELRSVIETSSNAPKYLRLGSWDV